MEAKDNAEKHSEEQGHVQEQGWSESIWSGISQVTRPLTKRLESYYYSAGTTAEPSDGVFQKISDFAAPLEHSDAESKEKEEESKVLADASPPHDGIMDRIANFASPLTDFIESYTEEEVPEDATPKENVFQKAVKERFDKKKAPEPPTWKDKIVNRVATLTSPLVDRFNIPVTLNGMDINDLSSTDQLVLGAIGFFILLVLFLVLRRRARAKREQQSPRRTRARTGSHDSPRNRARSGSFDAFLRTNSLTRDRFGTGDDSIEQARSLSKEDTPLVFGGAGVPSISYETWTPPMQWTEASRMLLPVNTEPKQGRKVTLDFQNGTLITERQQGEQNKQTFAMMDLSLHVKTPTVGGVLEVYLKDTPKDEWMEHTFKSAHQAAQFQQDLINYQVVGESIMNMYESLELIQKGSIAHDGKECVLHDDTSDSKKSAVAWDDAMRCFAGIKSLRKALDLDLIRRVMSGQSEGEENDAVAEDYVNNRLLLGRFDFYRLFVPNVEHSALPQPDSSPTRVNELLEKRKLVARASVMVQAFVQARTVANKGWNLNIDLPEDTFTKRLAYDEDIDNVQRDSTAKNEYYEATVSRDVRCEVHSASHLEKPGSSTMSKYQAFSLVGSQVFKLPPSGERHSLSHRKDPVLALPSLRKLVEAHPELDFFVCAFFPDGLGVAIVHVFVRSLPRGVDSSFDTIMDRFMNGTAEVRKRKLEVFMQLGPGARLSPLAWASLKTVSLLLSWSRRGEAQIPFESESERTPFPGMTLSNYMETTHFGGSLQTDDALPKNYAAVTTHVDASKMNAAMRVLYQRLEEGGLPVSVVDFTFVLEGQEVDELPERALGNIRVVHLDALKVALPPYYSASQGPTGDDDSVPEQDEHTSSISAFATPIIREMSVVWNSFMGSSRTLGDGAEETRPSAATPQNGSNGQLSSRDPFQAGVDALRDILRGVTVPVRRINVSSSGDSGIVENGDDSHEREDELINVPVLSRTSTDDLRRYFRATGCDLKEAAVRIVESAAWRGTTFPIDTRKCRVELQSGQFFQQGSDVDGDPVFYFQNMLMGPWRGNVNASVSALLHRLESSLNKLSEENPDVKCTVIALVGKPFKRISKKKKERAAEEEAKQAESASVAESKEADDADGEQSTAPSVAAHTVDQSSWNPFRVGANPRVYPTEDFQVHSDNLMFDRLAEVLSAHYPERLKRLILVPGQGRSVSYMNSTFVIRRLITSSRTRNKVVHLNRSSELPKFVEDNELVTFCGGWVEVETDAFEC